MPCRPQACGVVEGADMEVRLGRQARALAGQCRAASGAESACRPPRRRCEFADLAFGDAISRALEIDKDGNRRAAMLATTVAMAPVHPLRPARSNKPYRAAQATTF